MTVSSHLLHVLLDGNVSSGEISSQYFQFALTQVSCVGHYAAKSTANTNNILAAFFTDTPPISFSLP